MCKNHKWQWKTQKKKNPIRLAMSSWLSSTELLKCSASLYGNLEAPKENPREAKIHEHSIVSISNGSKKQQSTLLENYNGD